MPTTQHQNDVGNYKSVEQRLCEGWVNTINPEDYIRGNHIKNYICTNQITLLPTAEAAQQDCLHDHVLCLKLLAGEDFREYFSIYFNDFIINREKAPTICSPNEFLLKLEKEREIAGSSMNALIGKLKLNKDSIVGAAMEFEDKLESLLPTSMEKSMQEGPLGKFLEVIQNLTEQLELKKKPIEVALTSQLVTVLAICVVAVVTSCVVALVTSRIRLSRILASPIFTYAIILGCKSIGDEAGYELYWICAAVVCYLIQTKLKEILKNRMITRLESMRYQEAKSLCYRRVGRHIRSAEEIRLALAEYNIQRLIPLRPEFAYLLIACISAGSTILKA